MQVPRVDMNAKGKATASHCCEFRLKWPLFNRTQYKIGRFNRKIAKGKQGYSPLR